MFEEAKYIQNSFSITFKRDSQIRRKANLFEDLLKEKLQGHYSQPQLIAIPDDFEPEMPRLIFSSSHGFSQIIISQISMTLNVTYSPDWQINISKGKDYLQQRIQALFDLLSKADEIRPSFSGLITRVQLTAKSSEDEFLQFMREHIRFELIADQLHDVMFKETTVYQDLFFNNITIQNFRNWKLQQIMSDIPRYPRQAITGKGVEIISDFNDRYAYNEFPDYMSTAETGQTIIETGLSLADKVIVKLKGICLND
jgi:hypothetical protein